MLFGGFGCHSDEKESTQQSAEYSSVGERTVEPSTIDEPEVVEPTETAEPVMARDSFACGEELIGSAR